MRLLWFLTYIVFFTFVCNTYSDTITWRYGRNGCWWDTTNWIMSGTNLTGRIPTEDDDVIIGPVSLNENKFSINITGESSHNRPIRIKSLKIGPINPDSCRYCNVSGTIPYRDPNTNEEKLFNYGPINSVCQINLLINENVKLEVAENIQIDHWGILNFIGGDFTDIDKIHSASYSSSVNYKFGFVKANKFILNGGAISGSGVIMSDLFTTSNNFASYLQAKNISTQENPGVNVFDITTLRSYNEPLSNSGYLKILSNNTNFTASPARFQIPLLYQNQTINNSKIKITGNLTITNQTKVVIMNLENININELNSTFGKFSFEFGNLKNIDHTSPLQQYIPFVAENYNLNSTVYWPTKSAEYCESAGSVDYKRILSQVELCSLKTIRSSSVSRTNTNISSECFRVTACPGYSRSCSQPQGGYCDTFDYSCICHDGYFGGSCEYSRNPNTSFVEKNCSVPCINGHCNVQTGICECLPGVTNGPTGSCTVVLNLCPVYGDIICGGHGVCGNGTCICDEGFNGADCSLFDCPGSPDCSNAGTCELVNGNLTCKCYDGWTGDICSVPVCPELNGKICSGNGFCGSDLSPPRCVCDKYKTGKDCSQNTTYCGTTNNCSGKATCFETPFSGPGCGPCALGFAGLDCSAFYCTNTGDVECAGHGDCELIGGSPQCKCRPGYEGSSDCFLPTCKINLVDGKECSGNGLCDTDRAVPICDCNPYFYGDDCSEFIVPGFCGSDNNCTGNGECITEVTSGQDPYCECYPGWNSLNCSIQASESSYESSSDNSDDDDNNNQVKLVLSIGGSISIFLSMLVILFMVGLYFFMEWYSKIKG